MKWHIWYVYNSLTLKLYIYLNMTENIYKKMYKHVKYTHLLECPNLS